MARINRSRKSPKSSTQATPQPCRANGLRSLRSSRMQVLHTHRNKAHGLPVSYGPVSIFSQAVVNAGLMQNVARTRLVSPTPDRRPDPGGRGSRATMVRHDGGWVAASRSRPSLACPPSARKSFSNVRPEQTCTPHQYSCFFSNTRRSGNLQVQHRCYSADRSPNSPMQCSTRILSCALAVPQ